MERLEELQKKKQELKMYKKFLLSIQLMNKISNDKKTEESCKKINKKG